MSRQKGNISAVRAVAILWAIFGIPVMVVAVILLIVAVTTGGGLFALGTLLLCLAPTIWLFRKPRVSYIVFAGGIGCWIACLVMAPTKRDAGAVGDRVFVVYGNDTRHSWLSPANLVPEVDQQLLGAYLFGLADPSISMAQSKQLRSDIGQIYEPFLTDDLTKNLPSVIGFAYADLFLGSRPIGNKFVYIPESEADEPLPVIVFLHGSLGNFQAYWQLLRALADRAGVAIVAPTFGAGNWYLDGGMESVEDAMDFCELDPRIDSSRMQLAGLSNGGTGVTRAGALFAKDFQSLFLISPVLEIEITEGQLFQDGWRGRRVFVFTGTADKRVPVQSVKIAEIGMLEAGIEVRSEYFEGADHFLFFSQRQSVLNRWEAALKELSVGELAN